MTKRLLKIAFCLWSGLLVAASSNAAPAAGVLSSDSFAGGRTITLVGSGFGAKARPAPLYFWDFGHSSTKSSALSRLPSYSGPIRGKISAAVVAPGSTTALQVELGAGNERAAGPQDGVPFNSTSVYVWIKHRYDFNVTTASGPNGFNLKVFRLWYPYTHDIYVAYQGTGGSLVALENTQEAALWFHMRPLPRTWVIDEYDYQQGGIGTQDGVLNYTRNGIAAYSPNSRFIMRNTAYPQPYQILFFDQVSNNEVAPGTYQYIDSIYIDDTRQRVIVSDESSWSTRVESGKDVHREVQIPVSWSDSQIQVIARLGSLDSFANKFLYVIGADGNPVSAKGFPLTVSGSGPGAPTAPTGVAVH